MLPNSSTQKCLNVVDVFLYTYKKAARETGDQQDP